MIPFTLPQLSMTLSEYMEIVELQMEAGSCAGFIISLGQKFFSGGVSVVDRELLPLLHRRAPPGVNPRVMPTYSILLWFCLQVIIV